MPPSLRADSMPPIPLPTTRASQPPPALPPEVISGHQLTADQPGQVVAKLTDLPGERFCAHRAYGRYLEPLAVDARLREERLGLGDHPSRPLRAVGKISALVAVGGDEHTVEAPLQGVEHPRRLYAAGARQADDHRPGGVVQVRAAGQVYPRV